MAFASPPVPAKLREMLKDYPEHIEQLQQALISVSHGRQSYAPSFDGRTMVIGGLFHRLFRRSTR